MMCVLQLSLSLSEQSSYCLIMINKLTNKQHTMRVVAELIDLTASIIIYLHSYMHTYIHTHTYEEGREMINDALIH